jgi:hypothetical protein
MPYRHIDKHIGGIQKMIDKEKIKRRDYTKKGKKVRIGIAIPVKASAWMKEKGYSPTGLFNEALKEIGYKE